MRESVGSLRVGVVGVTCVKKHEVDCCAKRCEDAYITCEEVYQYCTP